MVRDKLPIGLALILVTALALVLSSCGSKGDDLASLDPNLYDQSWLTGKPCAAPCWYGLEPGVSSRQDSISTGKGLPFIDSSRVVLTTSDSTHSAAASLPCRNPRDHYCVYMDFSSDTLYDIWFVPNYQVTFDQAVEKLGAPDGFWLQPVTPGVAGCRLLVIWKDKRLILAKVDRLQPLFSFDEDLCYQVQDRGGKLPGNMLVDHVEIDLPGLIGSLMKQDSFQAWKGFAD